MRRGPWRALALSVAAIAAAAGGWELAGWAVGLLGIAELDLPARVATIFLVLTAAETAFSHIVPSGGGHG